ncbi:hypothetical protein ABKN59_010214 [Abortiporus biennis]
MRCSPALLTRMVITIWKDFVDSIEARGSGMASEDNTATPSLQHIPPSPKAFHRRMKSSSVHKNRKVNKIFHAAIDLDIPLSVFRGLGFIFFRLDAPYMQS